jgi:hypothetical protein
VRRSLWALKRRIELVCGKAVASRTHFSAAVAFPHCLFKDTPPADLPVEAIITMDDIADIQAAALRAFRAGGGSQRELSPQDFEAVCRSLAPEFQVYEPLRIQVDAAAETLARLTRQQLQILRGFDGNDRAIIEGVAGSGKTLFAIECARSFAAKCGSVLFTCYNAELAKWLREELATELVENGGPLTVQLQSARQRQLREPSIAAFLRRMERRTARPPGVRSSVLDLVDNGAELAQELRRLSIMPEADRVAALAGVVDPVVEICQSGARCGDTGLPLIDIWRHFRHTWAHECRPSPGRQLLILVRNAARRNRPVIGIAMLASPVMRVSVRDKWIGWLRDETETRLRDGSWEPSANGAALLARLDASIGAVRWDDLANATEIAEPTESTVLRLEQRASGAAFARKVELRVHYEVQREAGGKIRPMRGALEDAATDADWLGASQDLQFVRKRAEVLSQLLFAKQMFRAAGLANDPTAALDQLLAAHSGQRAIDIVLTKFRKAGLSSRIAGVSICGAIHPCNEILGGKLVALLLASREVHDAYSGRYSAQVSVIASQMAGRPVSKPADLRILTTTSLYGVGSSQ